MRLKGKNVLITGASKGIGRALALGLAAEGAHIILNYRTDSRGALAVARKILARGRRALVIQADLSRIAEIDLMFGAARRRFKRLDVLINNAAITGWTDLLETTEEQWDQVVDTNLKGTFFCSIAAARWMKETGGGCIINVSSNCAALGVRNLAAYATSKGGINALTKQLAVELAPYRIRVNTFAPGPTQVERNLRDDPDYDRTLGRVVPLGRTAMPEEMVGAAVFLASAESSYMTGQAFYVDGGWSVQGMAPPEYLDTALRKNR